MSATALATDMARAIDACARHAEVFGHESAYSYGATQLRMAVVAKADNVADFTHGVRAELHEFCANLDCREDLGPGGDREPQYCSGDCCLRDSY